MDTNQQKDRLEQLLSEVTSELNELGIHNPAVKEDWIATPGSTVGAEADPNIAADRVEEWEERRATLSLLEERYNNITKALQKIADGQYGVCEVGGEPIEAERLEANPAARTCIKHLEVEAELDNS